MNEDVILDLHPRTRQMLTYVDFPKDLTGKSVLDIGTAGGWWALLAESRGAHRIVATDIDRHWSAKFEAHNAAHGKGRIAWRRLDVRDLAEPGVVEGLGGPFDLVLFMAVYHHLESGIDVAFRGVHRAAGDYGRVIVEGPVTDDVEILGEHKRWGPGKQHAWYWVPTVQGLVDVCHEQFQWVSKPRVSRRSRAAVSCVARRDALVLIVGPPNAGKTTLRRHFEAAGFVNGYLFGDEGLGAGVQRCLASGCKRVVIDAVLEEPASRRGIAGRFRGWDCTVIQIVPSPGARLDRLKQKCREEGRLSGLAHIAQNQEQYAAETGRSWQETEPDAPWAKVVTFGDEPTDQILQHLREIDVLPGG